jgi:uncharacterized membrane protein YecN with MAPEG domain
MPALPVPITGLYAGLLAILALVLGFGVGRKRLQTGVSILDGGRPDLALAIRRHANFTEHVPLALLLLALIELNGARPGLLHGLGAALTLARIAHPLGLHAEDIRRPLRGIGSATTSLVTLIAAGVAIWQYLR